jgi:chorismate dehydratase
VWAVRPQAVPTASARQRLIADLNQSREHGLANVETLVREWTPRIAVPAETIRTYLTRNIHYTLDFACEEAILLFRRLAVESGILPPLPELHFLEP